MECSCNLAHPCPWPRLGLEFAVHTRPCAWAGRKGVPCKRRNPTCTQTSTKYQKYFVIALQSEHVNRSNSRMLSMLSSPVTFTSIHPVQTVEVCSPTPELVHLCALKNNTQLYPPSTATYIHQLIQQCRPCPHSCLDVTIGWALRNPTMRVPNTHHHKCCLLALAPGHFLLRGFALTPHPSLSRCSLKQRFGSRAVTWVKNSGAGCVKYMPALISVYQQQL